MRLDNAARSSLWLNTRFFLACFAGILLFQYLTGALNSDLGGDPDEAAHAVTSLMVRDYITTGFGQHPMVFAQKYYDAFPKVALGHYPPLYYIIAAVGLIPFPSTETLFVFQALFAAALATFTFHLGRDFLPTCLAALGGAITVGLPVALKLEQHIMSDILLAVLCLWAADIWRRYLDAPSLKKALMFGLVAAAAILTKGSGMLLCLVPPVATLLAGRWRLLKTVSWWASAVPVAILAGPWMIYSTKISKEGMTLLTPLQYFYQATPYYLKSLPHTFGWGFLVFAVIGLALCLRQAWQGKCLTALHASLAALTVGALAVLLWIPVGLTTRYLLPLLPILILLAAMGIYELAQWSPKRWSRWIGAAIMVGSFSLVTFVPKKAVQGFLTATQEAKVPKRGEPVQNWLVASDPRGEGAVVAAAAFQCQSRAPANLRVFRAGKELASSDWMGRGYKAAFTTEAEVLNDLAQKKIVCVFVDLSSPADLRLPHEKLLESALKSAPQSWQLTKEQSVTRRPGESGTLLVFRAIP